MEDLYKRLLEFTGDGVYRYTFDDGRILVANRGLVKILDLDCTPESLVGHFLKDLMVYTQREGTVRRELEEQGEIHGFEYSFRTLKGDMRWVMHDSFLVTDPETGQRVVEAVVRDITLRKTSEEALAQEKERLAVTLQSIGDAVIATDDRGLVVLLNSVAEQLTGWTQEEALGRPLEECFRIVNEQTGQPAESPLDRVLRQGLIVGLANHTAVIARDGSRRSIADSGAPIRATDGRILGMVLVFRDVTERRELNDELQRHREHLENIVAERTRELEEANDSLQRAKDAADAAARAKSEYLAIMSHEIRTPMNGVLGMISLLLDSDLSPDQLQLATLASTSAQRLIDVIDGILDFSRIESGRLALEHLPFDLGEMVRGVCDLLQIQARERGLELRFEYAEGLTRYLVGDQGRLRQVLMNLAGNAVKFTHEGSVVIEVDLLEETDLDVAFELRVRDTGIGIPPDKLEKIFDRFTQGDASTSRKYGGSGLGLEICKGLISLMGGTIGVRSTPGKGSTFWFRLRLPRAVPRNRRGPVTSIAESEERPLKAYALVVEDNAISQKVAEAFLQKLGCRVDVASDAGEALSLLREFPYDVVFMDCELPGVNGYEATAEIRRGGGQVRIIAMTAHSMPGDRQRCLDAGMNDFVSKPLRLNDLQAVLERWTPPHAASPPITKVLRDVPPAGTTAPR